MRLLKPVLSVSVLFSFSYAMNCSLVQNAKKWGDHYYTITTKKLTFLQAKEFAKESEGYLAIPNSAAENKFLQSLIPTPKYAWIGIYDPNYMTNYCYDDTNCAFDDSRFETIKGSPLTYKNWATNQPDNLVKPNDVVNGKQMVSPLGEHWVAMASTNGKWADFGNHAQDYNNPVKFFALIEFDKMPDCYTPPSDANTTDTIQGKVCNTQIYDNKTGNLAKGQTFQCLQDKYGTYYCPAALAPAKTYWDYEDGYSVAHTSTFTDKKPLHCSSGQVLYDGKCYLDYNHNGRIDSGDRHIYSVDGWYYIQHQNGFYTYTSKRLRYPVRMTISWKGDDYHFGAKIKRNGKLVWSRIVVPVRKYCYGDNYSVIPDGDIKNVIWDIFPSCYGYNNGSSAIGHGDFTFNPRAMTGYTKWGGEKNLANVVGDYFFVFFRDGGHGWDKRDYVRIDFKTHNSQAPFNGANPVNPVWCPRGYTDNGNHYCYTNLHCSSGEKQVGNTCQKTLSYTYYEYLCSNDKNKYGETYEPQNTGGDCHPSSTSNLKKTSNGYECNSPTPPKNNCKRKEFTCNSNIVKPVWVDNKWQCSPFPCIGNSDISVNDTPTGIDDANNNGWNANGTCSGKIYIFNGKDMRCRSDDAFGGLTGGGCCNSSSVFLGLVKCNQEEKILAKKNSNGMCHYVGKYCSKKLKGLGGSTCIRHKKTYCCFNSKLARIINEQGRPQLHKNWGDAKHPNCRGFTPEEFQKLDFSKMNLREFYNSLSQNVSQRVLSNMTQYIKKSIKSQLGNSH